MKKHKKILLLAFVFLGLLLQLNTVEVQAANNIKKSSISSVNQTDKQSVKITWKKVSGAKGYSIQYRIQDGNWETKNTTKNTLTISKLKVDKTYQFRVRAYKIINGKKQYGKYSSIKNLKVQSYKVNKTSITSVKQTGKNSVKIKWDKVSNVKAYSIQYKATNGTWKTKTTTKTSITLKNLETNKNYQFRVRAYKVINNKKHYAKYSVVKKLTLKDYIYMVDTYDPYNSSYYTAYKNGTYFMMGGKEQKNSFTLGQDYWGEDKKANFNIDGKYKKVSFNVGKVDGAYNSPYDGDFDVNIYADGILIKTINVKVEDLPQTVTIDLDNTERLTFEAETAACTLVGFSDVKLYYK